jgi:hypothetical protein
MQDTLKNGLAMVTGKIIEYDSFTNKFRLSKEKAQYLTRENNI